MTPVLDEVDDLDPKTGHPAPLSTISHLVNVPQPGHAPAIAQRFSALAHLGDGRRPSWRPVIEVLRANRPPMVEAVISSITRRRGDWVRWRPVLKQVLPWRS